MELLQLAIDKLDSVIWYAEKLRLIAAFFSIAFISSMLAILINAEETLDDYPAFRSTLKWVMALGPLLWFCYKYGGSV